MKKLLISIIFNVYAYILNPITYVVLANNYPTPLQVILRLDYIAGYISLQTTRFPYIEGRFSLTEPYSS